MSNIPAPWLEIVGVSETGIASLSAKSQNRIKQAAVVFGAPRFLSQLGEVTDQIRYKWQSPFSKMIDQIIQHRGTKTLILASGDPNWFGIGSTLSKRLDNEEFTLHPAPSSFQLAAARMHWPLQEITTISLHGRPVENLHKHLFPGARILALTSNIQTLRDVKNLLNQRGFSNSTLTVLENLGAPSERVTSKKSKDTTGLNIGDLYVLAIQCRAGEILPIQSTTPGLANELFEHDGQLTKNQVRAITLSSLAPYPGALLWDVGAGSGSIGIEWMRAASNSKAICFETNPKRCAAIAINKNSLGVPDLEIVQGNAIDMLGENPAPDAIFIGGNVADEKQFLDCWRRLKPGGKMVCNAVTMQSISALNQRQKTYGGQLFSIAISHQEQLGASTIMQPNLPVTQWVILKPNRINI